MSRKDYIALAEAIREEHDSWEPGADSAAALLALHNVTKNIATALYQDNPNFNREKFLAAALGA